MGSTKAGVKLLDIAKSTETLQITRRSAFYKSQYNYIMIGAVAILAILCAYSYSARMVRTGYVLFAIISFVVLLALLDRAVNLRRFAERDERYEFNRKSDAILHNGQPIASMSKIDRVILRRISDTEDATASANYSLIVALEDRNLVIAEATGLDWQVKELESAAIDLATFTEVEVERSQRTNAEFWMDS